MESCIAEKFEALASLGYDNSRFKDYYDLYILIKSYDFEGSKLQKAVMETFEHRNTDIETEIVAFKEGFAEDPIRKSRWNSFVKKKRTMLPVTLEETIELLKLFMNPVVNSIRMGLSFQLKWECKNQEWIHKDAAGCIE